MVSTCPACNQQTTHDDNDFEVVCKCGNRFNPFMLSNSDIPMMEPGVGSLNEHPEPPVSVTPAPNYQESASAFEELREFGENLIGGDPGPVVTAPTTPIPSSPGASAPRPAAVSVEGIAGDCLMTAGEQLSGFTVDAYLSPLSVASDLNLQGGDPLKPAFEALWNQAQGLGANGVVALRWAMTPDASKVLLSGTPVRVTKQG